MASKNPPADPRLRSARRANGIGGPRRLSTLAKAEMIYFRLEEFDCRCGRPDCDAEPLDALFLAKLNTLRELWGRPLLVTSGRRCKFWNAHVGGAVGSQHVLGKAADLRVESRVEADLLAELASKVGFGGIGIYATWVHVDVGPRRRWAA